MYSYENTELNFQARWQAYKTFFIQCIIITGHVNFTDLSDVKRY